MDGPQGKLRVLLNNRWLVLVAAMWITGSAGVAYVFGSISPVIKSSLGYNQRQLAGLGVAKDFGSNIGFHTSILCDVLPIWATLLIGAVQMFIGYGWVWAVVTRRVPVLPLWMMCILIFIGSNACTYFNTAAIVSCVKNFPEHRGPIVGILKGFAGLSGAIFTQIYAMIHTRDQASFILMVAVGPAMVVIAVMFIVRPVGGHEQERPSDKISLLFFNSVCLLQAAYLMGVMLLEDLVELSHTVIILLTVMLLFLLILPIAIPLLLTSHSDDRSPVQESLLPEPQPQKEEASKSCQIMEQGLILSEVEDEKPEEVDLLPASERQKRINAELQEKLVQAVDGVVKVKSWRGPQIGEDFTLIQALLKADWWLVFFSFLLGSGSGLTVNDNLGQMSQALGYKDAHIFVSMMSIWNFLGRMGGGYFSEAIVKDHAYPRHLALVIAQILLAIGHFFFAMGWPGTMYTGTLLTGLGYGAHWGIVPAAVSELFGLKSLGAMYNFLILANPVGTLVFSGLIASRIYDYEAEKQAHMHHHSRPLVRRLFAGTKLYEEEALKCEGAVCFFLSSLIMSGFCIVAVVLDMILIYRTKTAYATLYHKARS